MSKRFWIILPGLALVLFGLVALPGTAVPDKIAAAAVTAQEAATAETARLEQELARLKQELARIVAQFESRKDALAGEQLDRSRAQLAKLTARMRAVAGELGAQRAALAGEAYQDVVREIAPFQDGFDFDGDRGWLGVTIEEVSAEKAKELKLPAVRGVYLSEVAADSPAAKAGLKSGDVITEFNGQRVEGTAQFGRMLRETPAGRTAQLTIWRDGRAQSVTAEVGSFREHFSQKLRIMGPKNFDFHIEMPEFGGNLLGWRTPTIGIDAEDLHGQLGAYFGVPDGEGILVREVRSGTPAEKAGLKAGDVITKMDGVRVRSVSELREKLREKRESKTVGITVIRKGAEVALNVEIEQPKPPAERKRVISHRTSI